MMLYNVILQFRPEEDCSYFVNVSMPKSFEIMLVGENLYSIKLQKYWSQMKKAE